MPVVTQQKQTPQQQKIQNPSQTLSVEALMLQMFRKQNAHSQKGIKFSACARRGYASHHPAKMHI